MKKLFLLIFAVLLVLGSALPLAAYRVTRAVLGHTTPLPAASSVPELPASQPEALPSADAEIFPVEDQSAGKGRAALPPGIRSGVCRRRNAGQLAGRSAQGTGCCRPHLRALLPGSCRPAKRCMAHR